MGHKIAAPVSSTRLLAVCRSFLDMVARSGRVIGPGLLQFKCIPENPCREAGNGGALTGDCIMRIPHRWVNAIAVGMGS